MFDDGAEPFPVRQHPEPITSAVRKERMANPGFGRVFTDHMAVLHYSEGKGWHDGAIQARAPFQIDPASAVLHYAQEIFEGLKAYRAPDGGALLFRPEANAQRFNRSADRMSMPNLPEELFVESVKALTRTDRDWIPDDPGGSLYLRPFMIANEVFLGVKPSAEYLYVVIASTVGNYFKSGAPTVTLWVSQVDSRSGPGGTGAAKCGGNYASSLRAQAEAIRNGCDQTLFLDASERKYVEELGGMNVFFVFDDGSMLTPPLDGSILPGVTRDSIIRLMRDKGVTVREERYSIEQWQADAKSGRLREAFACGTAAVIAPISKVKAPNFEIVMPDSGNGGPTTLELRANLVDIQRGLAADPYGWVTRVF